MDRHLRSIAVAATLALGANFGAASAQPAMVTLNVATVSKTDRQALLNLVTRSDVSSQLQSLGVDPVQAKARIASMTDQEVTTLAAQIDSLPAGAMSKRQSTFVTGFCIWPPRGVLVGFRLLASLAQI